MICYSLKVKCTNLKCMGIMQDNLCHPYITVLSDTVGCNDGNNNSSPIILLILLVTVWKTGMHMNAKKCEKLCRKPSQ